MTATRPSGVTAPNDTPVVIIGAGVGGLSAAISLAAAGRRVMMFEQGPAVGGKMSQITADGFRWDTGPSVITMRNVFAGLFARAGRRLDDYLELLPLEPLTRYFYADGSVLDVSRDWSQMAASIAAWEPRDVAGYLRFLAFAAELHRITGPVFIYNQPPTPASFLRVAPWDMLKVDAWSTLDAAIRRHVRDPRLRQMLGRFATYVGASPYRAPATLGVIAHVELTGGVWYPRGGIYRIAAALEQLARELGVIIHTDTPVARIEVASGRVVGLRLAATGDDPGKGELVPAREIIANVDVATVYDRLLPPDAVPPGRKSAILRQETSCSGFVLLLGVNRLHDQLAHHNIFFARDYRREFDDIFDRGVPPADPTVYVAISAKSDPEHAPPGQENWFVLVNAPAIDSRFDWATQARPYRDLVMATLARHGLNIEPAIVSEQILTPHDIAQRTGAHRGALYGISSNNPLNAFRRPHNRAPLDGLYFAGGTTHPGGGVPMVTLSGMLVADMLLGRTTSV
jgi:phytoene desaturase